MDMFEGRLEIHRTTKDCIVERPDFYAKGPTACSQVADPDIFLPEGDSNLITKQVREAKKTCAGCQYVTECLMYAAYANEPGVWGGTTYRERARLKRAGKTPMTNARFREV